MKIAIVDSGIHPGHPHVGEVAGGIALAGDDTIDRLGHGTAIAGAIRERAPDAELYAVKVFDRRLSANSALLIRALEWCAAEDMDIVNLSVATKRPLPKIDAAPVIVTVSNVFDGAIAVLPDESCPRDAFRFRDGIFYASPYPRSVPGVPAQRNLHGASFAVANMTGFVAQALAQSGRARLVRALRDRAADESADALF